MSFRIVGIDPGSYHMGVGCIEKKGNSFRFIHGETLSVGKQFSLFERLEKLSGLLVPLIQKLEPQAVAIEDVFYGQNARSAFHLGMARGVALSCCFGKCSAIYEYAPTKIKMVVTGTGRADKDQVAKMVQIILGKFESARHDTTDALAVALCHAISSQVINLERRLTC